MSDEKISTKVLCAIFATGILSFCGVAGETAMNITFPVLMKAFSVNTSTVQWVTTIYLLVVACVVPLSAYLKRSFRMKTIFLVANLLSILGVLIDFIAPSFGFVVLGRLVQGMGVGFALPLMFNIILEQVPSRKIGLMMGVGTLITAVAPAIGPTVGGLLTAHFGWRSIFLVQFPILLASLIAGIRSIEQKSEVQRELGARKPILIGAILIVLAQLLFSLFGLSLSNTLILVFYMIFMTGLGVSFGNVMTNGQKQLSLDQRADANAIFNTLQQFAGAVGTTLASLIVAMSQANHKVDFAQATAQGSRNGFMVLFALAIFQLLVLVSVVKKND